MLTLLKFYFSLILFIYLFLPWAQAETAELKPEKQRWKEQPVIQKKNSETNSLTLVQQHSQPVAHLRTPVHWGDRQEVNQ